MVNGFNNDTNKDGNPYEGINKCFMVADGTWTWLNFRGNLIKDAMQGVAISLTFAFIVILMTT